MMLVVFPRSWGHPPLFASDLHRPGRPAVVQQLRDEGFGAAVRLVSGQMPGVRGIGSTADDSAPDGGDDMQRAGGDEQPADHA